MACAFICLEKIIDGSIPLVFCPGLLPLVWRDVAGDVVFRAE
jgi:hypothetical protein